MALTQQIIADIKEAMLARQSEKTGVLRMLHSEIKNAQINLGHELSDDEIIAVVRKEVKKRNESAALYTKHDQPERATQETAEAAILSVYLPAAVDSEVLKTFLTQTVSEMGGEFSPALRGKLIQAALAKFGNQTDGKQINEALTELFKA